MKFLLALMLLTSVAMADHHEGKGEEKHEMREEASEKNIAPGHREKKKAAAAAYKTAKEECLKENKDFKKNELHECIVSKTK